jgi:hypothetical protein
MLHFPLSWFLLFMIPLFENGKSGGYDPWYPDSRAGVAKSLYGGIRREAASAAEAGGGLSAPSGFDRTLYSG